MEQADDLMRKVWAGTPWMIEAYTGNFDDARSQQIAEWCEDNFGPEAWPIHGHPGKWHRGGATINGFTWLGFATEDMMNQFQAAWPNRVIGTRRRCVSTSSSGPSGVFLKSFLVWSVTQFDQRAPTVESGFLRL